MTDLRTGLATACVAAQHWEHAGIRVIECATCGFRHQDPLPTPDEVAALYADAYYSELKPDYGAIVERDRAQFELWAGVKRSICDRLLDAVGAGIERSVLDVGASFGQLLVPFTAAGWRAVGVEPAPGPAEFADGHADVEVHTGMLEDVPTETLGAPFDVVHLGEVLNHLLDPVETMRRITEELLAPGGVVVIETSNDFNELQAGIVDGLGHDHWWIVPDHVTYFDRHSLARLMERFGLGVAQTMGTFPMELFPLLGWDYLADGDVGPDCHRRRVGFELGLAESVGPDVLERLYTALGSAGFGRAVITFAQARP